MKHENFIRTYSDVLSDNCVSQLQDIANNQDNLNVNTERGLYKNSYISYKRNSPYKKDKQIVIEPFWPDLANYINLQLVESAAAAVTPGPVAASSLLIMGSNLVTFASILHSRKSPAPTSESKPYI